MDFKNIGSIKYLWELNAVYATDKEGDAFINKNRPKLFRKCLNTFLEKIIPEGEFGDVHLGYFYSWGVPLKPFLEKRPLGGLTLSIFPTKGIVEEYVVNSKEDFFTNIHQKLDPIIITDIQTGLYIHPSRTDSSISYGRKGHVLNRIWNAVLFKQNPIENKNNYDGFEGFLEEQHQN